MCPLEINDLPTVEIIRRFVSKPSAWHKREPGVYHASSVWYCLRRNYYDLSGLPKDEGPQGLFEMGRRAEAVLMDALVAHYGARFVRNNIPVRYEAPFDPSPDLAAEHDPLPTPPKFVIVGETDPVLFGWNNVVKRIYEAKSSEIKDKEKNNPTEERHKRQASFYAGQLETEAGWPEVYIVHPGRSDVLNFAETILNPGDVQRHYIEAVEYFHQLDKALTDKTLPPAEPKDSGECHWCPFKAKCIQDGGWELIGAKWVRKGEMK